MKITTKQECISVMAEIEVLYQKGFSSLSKDEEERLDLLARAVETWEKDTQGRCWSGPVISF